MKSILSKQESKVTILSYKSVLTSYLILGLDETLRIVNDGNKDVLTTDLSKLIGFGRTTCSFSSYLNLEAISGLVKVYVFISLSPKARNLFEISFLKILASFR